jgi:hypothetical protein
LKTGTTNSSEIWVKVNNVKPILTTLDVQSQDQTKDPVIISVSAL